MRIIPVIDLMGGQVVRGVGGRRDEYRPVVSQIAADAQPLTVARAFRSLGYDEVYVADLDAIADNRPAWSEYDAIAAAGLKLWVDAGLSSLTRARQLCNLESSGRRPHRIVVGLETLESFDLLDQFIAAIGRHRLVFSLDLKWGVPLTANQHWRSRSPLDIANEVLALGVQRLIVLDLADVGEASGTGTLSLCRQIRTLDADVELISGGGIRAQPDLNALEDAGCNAALVASALHDGRLPRSRESDSRRAKSI